MNNERFMQAHPVNPKQEIVSQEEISKSAPLYTRRQAFVVITAGVVSAFLANRTAAFMLSEFGSGVNQVKQNLDPQLPFDLDTAQDLLETNAPFAAETELILGIKFRRTVNADWNMQTILMAGEYLNALPKHFRAMSDNTELTLVRTNNSSVCGCSGQLREFSNGVQEEIFEVGSFESTNPLYARILVDHEGGHKVDYDNKHVSWPKIDKILGGYLNVKDEVREKLKNIPFSDPSIPAYSNLLNDQLNYGFSKPTLIELVA